MSKEYGKVIVIKDETLTSKFRTEDFENCTFIFENCTLMNFYFRSTKNSIEFSSGNTFCESIYLDAKKVIIKEKIHTENLDSLSINGGYFKMPEGATLKAFGSIAISSDIQSLKNNCITTMSTLILQSSIGTTTYQNCSFTSKYGIKIATLRGNLKIENCELNVTDANPKISECDHLNGIYLSCYGKNSRMQLISNIIKTDILEIVHPNYMMVHNTELYRMNGYGRLLSRNQEHLNKVMSYNYIEEETHLDQFYQAIELEKNNPSKILGLFGIAFKKSA